MSWNSHPTGVAASRSVVWPEVVDALLVSPPQHVRIDPPSSSAERFSVGPRLGLELIAEEMNEEAF